MHACILLPGRSALHVCVCVCAGARCSRLDIYICMKACVYTAPLSFGCNFRLPPPGPIFCDKNEGVYILSFTYRAIPLHSSGTAPVLSRHAGARSLCGAATEDSVTNGNYICVFFMNPSNTGLLKCSPGIWSCQLLVAGTKLGCCLDSQELLTP